MLSVYSAYGITVIKFLLEVFSSQLHLLAKSIGRIVEQVNETAEKSSCIHRV